jgi:BASS family bile acid:Na+ symporter
MFSRFEEYEFLLAQCQLILFMTGMGATLRPADFARIVREPRSLLAALACQYVLVPLLAVAVNHLLVQPAGLSAGFAIGLVVIAAMPGGVMSKFFTFLGRGNLALSVTLTAGTTLASLVTVPLLLRLLAVEYIPENMEMPVGLIVLVVAVFMLAPLGLGMFLGWLWPNHRMVLSRWCVRLGLVFVVAMIVGSTGSGRISGFEFGWQGPAAIILFCLLAQQLSLLPFRLMRWPSPDCLAVGIEVTMRNVNLGLLLNVLLFPPTDEALLPINKGVLFVLLYYAMVGMAAGAPLALRYRFTHHRKTPQLVAEHETHAGGIEHGS